MLAYWPTVFCHWGQPFKSNFKLDLKCNFNSFSKKCYVHSHKVNWNVQTFQILNELVMADTHTHTHLLSHTHTYTNIFPTLYPNQNTAMSPIQSASQSSPAVTGREQAVGTPAAGALVDARWRDAPPNSVMRSEARRTWAAVVRWPSPVRKELYSERHSLSSGSKNNPETDSPLRGKACLQICVFFI